jgi:hypothetical protein
MSLIVTTHVPEGIATASDSRQSIRIEIKSPDGKDLPPIETVSSDSADKTFLLEKFDKKKSPIFQVGVSVFGESNLGGVPTGHHIKKFIEEELTTDDNVGTIPEKIVAFFHKQFPKADTGFHVIGYKKKEGEASEPFVYSCHVAKKEIKRVNLDPKDAKKIVFGASWSGQGDVLGGILSPTLAPAPNGALMPMQKAPIIWDAMTLQDAIDFCIYSIRTTIDTIRFQARPKNVGGPIDVLLITPDGAQWIQKKELRVN